VPQFYLTGFTHNGTRDGELWVMSRADGRRWRGTPNTVGHERDFYRADDAPDLAVDEIERLFADVEGDLAPVLRGILETTQLPPRQTREFNAFLNLVALMHARVPSTRSILDRFAGSVARLFARTITESPERFQAAVGAAREGGVELPDHVDYEAMREFVEAEHFAVQVSRAWLVGQIFESVEVLLPLLAARQWAVFVAGEADGDFITSDKPVMLTWSERRETSYYSPAFGLRHTDLTFPLGKRCAALGRFEGPAGAFPASPAIIAAINSRTGLYCERFICSAREEFPWPRQGGAVGGAADFIACVRAQV
jgi:hypothetical protein